MSEAKTAMMQDGVGQLSQLLAQMGAVRHKRKRNSKKVRCSLGVCLYMSWHHKHLYPCIECHRSMVCCPAQRAGGFTAATQVCCVLSASIP